MPTSTSAKTPASPTADSMSEKVMQSLSSECGEVCGDFQVMAEDVSSSVADYCRKQPLVAGLAVFAIGFYVGWKVKPW